MKKNPCAPAPVASVEPGSPADSAGLAGGDMIHRIDGRKLRDAIDVYSSFGDTCGHLLEVERGGRMVKVAISAQGSDPGILLARPVFDEVRICENNCMFCFVDQLPEGLRKEVYVKDDDYRLSFLGGNFITLTNTGRSDIRRIVRDRLSPLYVSIHSTDPSVRKKMFGNPEAPRAMKALKDLLKAGISLHLQIVLVRGVNDRAGLDRTLEDLCSKYAGAATVGVVPVGFTEGGRRTLPEKFSFDRETAFGVLEQVERWRPRMEDRGTRLCAADEFFFMAGKQPPDASYYGDFEQLENGIGITRLFRDEYAAAARGRRPRANAGTVIVTTPIGAWGCAPLELEESGARLAVCTNSLFGRRVDVCGLLPGKDAAEQLANAGKVSRALVPEVALNDDKLFIDGTPLAAVSASVGAPVKAVPARGAALVEELYEG